MSSRDIFLRSKLKLGKRLFEARRFDEARSVYAQICSRRTNDVDSWFTLGAINGMLKRHQDVVACCSKVVALEPRHSAAWYNLGIALRETGQTEKAAAALRQCLSIDPKHVGAATSLGHILATLHRYEEAEEVFRRLLASQPGDAEFYAIYGSAMHTMLRYEAAIKAYRKAIDLGCSRQAEVLENMAAALCMQGKLEESVEAFRSALEASPGNPRIYSGMLLTLQYLSNQDAEDLRDMHRCWPGNARRPTCSLSPSVPATRPERLRIGYVSSDFRTHSVAYFVEPLLAHHDATRFEVTCYFSHKDADAITARLQGYAHRWRNVAGLDDQQFQQLVTDDRIDILLDLNGHTAGNRLAVFASRAAPVQVSFIGYPATSGVAEMDYRLSDAVADPPGAERFCAESLVRLPGCFLCYRPLDNAPAVTRPPCETNGFVTFGSFNNLAKMNPEVIALWARLLRAIPDSHLLIKNPSLTDRTTRERYTTLFTDAGVPSEHLGLIGYVAGEAHHLANYSRIDIGLDTFPYNGTTTTCEALWMGVPVVSLRGARHSARVGASLLTAVGHPDWIADTPEQYIHIAQRLALDTGHLAQLRASLRGQMSASHLCSAQTYAKAVEDAFDEMEAARRASART